MSLPGTLSPAIKFIPYGKKKSSALYHNDTRCDCRRLVCFTPGKSSKTISPGSGIIFFFMRILAVRWRECGKVLEVLLAPGIAKVDHVT